MAFVPNIKFKTEYCLYWQEGTLCEKGAQCFFAHGEKELRTIEEVISFPLLCSSIVSLLPFAINPNHQQIMARQTEKVSQEGRPNNYKTIFCKFYAEGQCKLGDKCTYAHERRERRKKKHSQEYKQDNGHQSNWSQQQINDYYQQMYYYQMYQMPQPPFIYPNHPFPEPDLDPSQQMMLKEIPPYGESMEESSEYEEKERRPTFDSSELKSKQKLSSETPPVKKKVETPSSGQTEGTTNGTLTNLDVLDHSSEFKTES